MIVVLKPNLPPAEVEKVIAEVAKLGYEPRPIHGKVQTVIAAIGDENTHQSLETLSSWPQVEHVHRVQKRYKLVSREVKKGEGQRHHPESSRPGNRRGQKVLFHGGTLLGRKRGAAHGHREGGQGAGGDLPARRRLQAPHLALRIPGPGQGGLRLLSQAAKEYDLGIVTEVLSERDVELVAAHSDILQIGARNAQNFSLITEAARSGKPSCSSAA
jgi:3-deoxy-7-phosphoheptulonate synthase